MTRRITSVILILILTFALCPAACADNISIDKVNIETYPYSGAGNDLPTVGQQASTFYAGTITAGVSVVSCTLTDDNGSVCTGTVENKNYTLSVVVQSNAVNYLFSYNTKAYINGVNATITPSGDGLSATVSRYIKPNVIDPVIYKNPSDENHDKSSLFSFTASASKVYTSFQWYIMTTYGEKFTPEELSAAYPGVTTSVKDLGDSVRLNIGNPMDGMSGWLVYCIFKGYSGAEVATSKAQMTIKGAVETTLEIVQTPEPTSETTTVNVDGEDIEVPEGITIVETPEPEITIVEAPEETAEVTPTPAAEPETELTEDTAQAEANKSKALKIIKWGAIVLGGVIAVGLISMFISYTKEKSKAKKRAKMAGRYKSRH